MDSEKMAVLMGGSGSTGSGLLRTILNRHPALFSGAELSFFNKDQYYLDWPKYKKRALYTRWRRPLSTRGWFAYPGSALLHDDYGWERDDLERVIADSRGIREFAERFFRRPVERSGARTWIEKTPSNSYCFGQFLERFEQGKVIHTARNPQDAVKSLVYRGMSPFYASALWLYNTACALSVVGSSRYHLVRYEDLVTEPERTVRATCEFLGVSYESDMLEPDEVEDESQVRNEGWTHARTDPIRSGNIGTFSALDGDRQAEVLTALTVLRISERHRQERGLPVTTAEAVCDRLGYAGFEEERSRIDTIVRERWMDMFHRAWRRLPSSLWNYPIDVEEPVMR